MELDDKEIKRTIEAILMASKGEPLSLERIRKLLNNENQQADIKTDKPIKAIHAAVYFIMSLVIMTVSSLGVPHAIDRSRQVIRHHLKIRSVVIGLTNLNSSQ